jgi:hypothetical protein
MEFFLTVAFLINDVERRFHYQYDSFQECSQAREVMVKDENPTPSCGPLAPAERHRRHRCTRRNFRIN